MAIFLDKLVEMCLSHHYDNPRKVEIMANPLPPRREYGMSAKAAMCLRQLCMMWGCTKRDVVEKALNPHHLVRLGFDPGLVVKKGRLRRPRRQYAFVDAINVRGVTDTAHDRLKTMAKRFGVTMAEVLSAAITALVVDEVNGPENNVVLVDDGVITAAVDRLSVRVSPEEVRAGLYNDPCQPFMEALRRHAETAVTQD